MLTAYIASPYSRGDQALNVRRAVEAADRVWAIGVVPYVPHLTMLYHIISPKPYAEWLAMDEEWLARSDYLIRLEGESAGADREVAFARERGIPVYHGVDAFLRAVCGPAKEYPDGP
jgi:hypothetical protein